METLYRCKFTGDIFENKMDCEISEYEHGGGVKQFASTVDQFIIEIEKQFGVEVDKSSIVKIDTLHKNFGITLTRDRRLHFAFTLNGVECKYNKRSDNVGDGRWVWHQETVEQLVEEFYSEYILKTKTEFEGVLECRMVGDDDYYDGVWMLGEVELDKLVIVLQDKRVAIKVLGDENE